MPAPSRQISMQSNALPPPAPIEFWGSANRAFLHFLMCHMSALMRAHFPQRSAQVTPRREASWQSAPKVRKDSPTQVLAAQGIGKASGQGPCPPPAQPLGTDSVVNATMILISAGAIAPGSSRDGKNRQQKVTAGRGNTPNLLRQPAVGGDHKALSLSSWKVKLIQASNTRLSNDRPTVAQSPSGL